MCTFVAFIKGENKLRAIKTAICTKCLTEYRRLADQNTGRSENCDEIAPPHGSSSNLWDKWYRAKRLDWKERICPFGSKARTYAVQQAMSALPRIATAKADSRKRSCPLLPPKADMCGAIAHVCYGPIGDIASRQGPFARLPILMWVNALKDCDTHVHPARIVQYGDLPSW
jgi:hypothetical protein